jgi:hypothetical protein
MDTETVTMKPARTKQAKRVLQVEFEGAGETWTAVGGGDTIGDAIAFARESLPGGRRWRARSWRDLYGL